MRPTAALFPLVLLAAALFGNAVAVAELFICYCAMQLFTLCSIDAFRNAAAREPGVRRVDKRFSGTFPVVIIGFAAFAALVWFKADKTSFMNKYVWIIAASGSILIEQLFEERMWALGHPVDGVMLSIISNVLLLVGLLVDASSGMAALMDVYGFYTICGAGLGLLISVFTSYAVEPMRAFSLIPRNIAFFPKAAVQSLLYPAVIFGIYALNIVESGYKVMYARDMTALMTGLILWRLGRTVCRRANDESRPLNLLVTAFPAVIMVISLWVAAIFPWAEDVVVAMICVVIVFCASGWRIYTGVALVTAAWLLLLMNVFPTWIAAACCTTAVILNMNKAFLRKV